MSDRQLVSSSAGLDTLTYSESVLTDNSSKTQVKYQHLLAPARAAATYLTLETEVHTMRKWQNHHRLFIGVICSQGHVNPSKNVAGMCNSVHLQRGQVTGVHIIFKSPSDLQQAFVHIISMSPFEEFHKGKNRSQYLMDQELKLFCFEF